MIPKYEITARRFGDELHAVISGEDKAEDMVHALMRQGWIVLVGEYQGE